MKLEITSSQNTIRFAGDLDIYGAGTALHALCEHLAARPAMELDLGGVTACDAAGLQLLLALMAGCLLRAIAGDKLKWWIAAGVCAGLGLLVHFRFAAAGIAVLVFLIANPMGRSLWKRKGLYVTAVLAALGLLPAVI